MSPENVRERRRRKRSRKETPTCIEEGCDRKVRKRQNWHTMSDEYAWQASPYHHRCGPCYAAWLCRTEGRKPTRAAKPYDCDGCGRRIQKGTVYNLTFRTAFLHAVYPERVHVCTTCVPIPGPPAAGGAVPGRSQAC